jgi:hypothetical protein
MWCCYLCMNVLKTGTCTCIQNTCFSCIDLTDTGPDEERSSIFIVMNNYVVNSTEGKAIIGKLHFHIEISTKLS